MCVGVCGAAVSVCGLWAVGGGAAAGVFCDVTHGGSRTESTALHSVEM